MLFLKCRLISYIYVLARNGVYSENWIFGSEMVSGFNPIQAELFWPSLDWGVVSNAPLRFLKTIKDIDMKLTPLIKCRQINPLLLSNISCDVT